MAGWFLELKQMHGTCHPKPSSGRFKTPIIFFVDNGLETKLAPRLILMPPLTQRHLAEMGKFLPMSRDRNRDHFGTPGCIAALLGDFAEGHYDSRRGAYRGCTLV
jgi:hypothetical protein